MGAITAELVDVGERRGARGRRVLPAERREQLIAEYRTSGLTMAAFARREGIKYATFAGWMAKAQPGAMMKPPIRFAEMRLPLGPTATSPQNDYPVEVRLVKREIVRPKFRHKLDRNRPPVIAAAPARPVNGGYASAGLLA